MRTGHGIWLFVVASILPSACAPNTFTRVRMGWDPYDEREYKQQKEGVTVEMRNVKTLPETGCATNLWVLGSSRLPEPPRTVPTGR